MSDVLEFSGIAQEDMGALSSGFLRFSPQGFSFKNIATGKVLTVNVDDIEDVFWQRLANRPGIKFSTKNGVSQRFCGFKDTDFNKISQFGSARWHKELTKRDLSLKGWNYGDGKFEGQNLVFEVDRKPAFEVPLSNVSNCTSTKSEVSLEFHINDDCPVQLVEMRFHVPQNPEKGDDVDEVEEFRKAIMQFADVEVETDQPLVMLPEILCTTPRGRYDIKVFHNQLFFHGKTHDYKIPFKTITRMFLLPHKDNRHMFFALHINPPIRQGQTRYPFLVLEFAKDEHIEVDLGATDEQLKVDYEGKLERQMKGLLYEVVAKLFRVLIKSRIIIPGSFEGASGTAAIACAYRQSSGYLYPLEKGFIYIHKPPMYIRFEEVDNVHFARSDVSTRSFDFEIVNKTGSSILFSSVGKEEYNKLYDFVHKKGLKIRNATRLPDKPSYKEDKFAGSDEEMDHYKEGLKQDVRDRAKMDDAGDSDSDSEDDDFDVEKAERRQKAEKDSSEGSGSEPDEEFDTSDDSVSDDMLGRSKNEKPKKKEKSAKKEKKSKEAKSSGGGKGRETKKRKKDPNAPKRNQTAFFHWSNENRSKIRKDNDTVADTAVRAGQMWKELTAADKEPYEKRAREDKERYELEMRNYQANKKDDSGEEDEAPSSSKSAKKSSASAKPSTSSPSKKAISREFVEDSDDSSAESEPAAKKNKKSSSSSVAKEKKREKEKPKARTPPSSSSAGEGSEEEEEDSDSD